ncbi:MULTISPECIES: ABC-ATPase domain-containing protein [Geobacillus]|uniref:ABC-ATPase domain-containing protein n=1 Tax=Geobacillus zalihae TaxID=213419 RepID=A0A7H1RU78_9BACL|nr:MULTISPECIES: ABC-ATPase domain-containing protein [Geobacillus]EPR28711.1 Isopentenyl-diphosphate delta-isomerase [Geobacillus sp. WSUCF1]OQP23412.1 ATPase [Geobacillus zalihae]QNU17817.1 ABC-ATPase domain-containing protein [Geobacillus zalihae]
METLRQRLRSIDQKGYKAYKAIEGTYRFPMFTLAIDHVQGDPFAEPSKVRVIVPRAKTALAAEWTNTKPRRVRCEDVLARRIHHALRQWPLRARGSGKSGLVLIDAPGQKVLERTAVQVADETITVCLSVGLPANGRRILAKEAEAIFFEQIPSVIERAVYGLREEDIRPAVELADQQHAIRRYLREHGLVAFVKNGAILPRESGVSDKPLQRGAVPFQSPPELEIAIPVPHRAEPIKGMGIRKGITLIVGGGYHGKSTLLQALEHGVYDHIAGDGREFVITDSGAVKIRAEDGRSVASVDISPLIGALPYGKETTQFSTENASGSTSQAASMIEMIEAGASAFLIDEDTSATNLLIRDARMQALVAKEAEPITPYIDKARQLFRDYGISTVLVVGGLGDYLDIADCVIKMEQYVPFDVTGEAKRIAAEMPSGRKAEGGESFGRIHERIPLPESLNSQKGKKAKAVARGRHVIQYGQTDLLLYALEQLVDDSQTRAIAAALLYMERKGWLDGKKTIRQLLDAIEEQWDRQGLGSVSFRKGNPGELARPRRFELAAALNRLRTLRCRQR